MVTTLKDVINSINPNILYKVYSGSPPLNASIGDVIVNDEHDIFVYNGRVWERMGSGKYETVEEDTTPLNIKIKRILKEYNDIL